MVLVYCISATQVQSQHSIAPAHQAMVPCAPSPRLFASAQVKQPKAKHCLHNISSTDPQVPGTPCNAYPVVVAPSLSYYCSHSCPTQTSPNQPHLIASAQEARPDANHCLQRLLLHPHGCCLLVDLHCLLDALLKHALRTKVNKVLIRAALFL